MCCNAPRTRGASCARLVIQTTERMLHCQRSEMACAKCAKLKQGNCTTRPTKGLTIIDAMLPNPILTRELIKCTKLMSIAKDASTRIYSNNARYTSHIHNQTRCMSSTSSSFQQQQPKKKSWYVASAAVGMFAVTFATVPLYKLYCQAYGKGGTATATDDVNKVKTLKIDKSRLIEVQFHANTHSSIDWNFRPLTDHIKVYPGETALAFYRAKNPLDELVIGVATYTVLPYEAGQYFNKIQCFCFEEQMLQPREEVFMPVLFYLDPEFSKDPALSGVTEVTLHYTFFRSKDGEILELDELDEPIEIKKHN